MWQGILAGLESAEASRERRLDREEARQARADALRFREEDVALRREQFERTLLEKRRSSLLPFLKERMDADRASQEMIQSGISAGLNPTVADALYRSGQLQAQLETIEKNNYSPTIIKGISDTVLEQLNRNSPEGEAESEELSSAMDEVFSSGVDLRDPEDSMTAVMQAIINATSIEQLESVQETLFRPRPKTGVSRFDLQRDAEGIGQTDVSRARTEIINRIESAFGANNFVLEADGTRNLAPNAAPDVAMVVNRALDEAVDKSRGPRRTGNLDENVAIIGNKIMSVAGQQVIDARDIYDNFDTLMDSTPDDFLEFWMNMQGQVEDPSPVSVRTPDAATATQAIGDMRTQDRERQQRRRFQPQDDTPPAGFSINIEDELFR